MKEISRKLIESVDINIYCLNKDLTLIICSLRRYWTTSRGILIGFRFNSTPKYPNILKILPTTNYLIFTAKAIDLDRGEYYFKNWLPQSKYEQAYPYIIQAYDAQRFKSLEDEESEIDWYIPIKIKL